MLIARAPHCINRKADSPWAVSYRYYASIQWYITVRCLLNPTAPVQSSPPPSLPAGLHTVPVTKMSEYR